uniref:'chromo' domain containing protein n=1 Tax=Solanum tuberosum TaxID=4113 RepID=M1DPB9_SOLTU
MVNTRFNGVRPAAPVYESAEESAAKGRGRARGKGRRRVAPAKGGASTENVPREEALPAPQEEVKENVEIEDEENVGQEKDAPARNTGVPPLDLVLAQHIMYFLRNPSSSASYSISDQPPHYCYYSQCRWSSRH